MHRVHTYEIIVRESLLDSYGHVNNAAYLTLFEEARWEWITSQGYGMNVIHRLKKGPLILEAHLEFKREMILREEISICSWVESYVKKICNIRQQMVKSDGQIACEARFVACFFDLTERKIILPSPEWLKAVGWSEDSSQGRSP